MTAPSPRSKNRTAAYLFILSGALALGGLALVGLPGAVFLAVGAPIAALFTDQRVPGDGWWPMAIIQTLLWPWVLPPAYLLAAWNTLPGRWRVLTTAGYSLLGAVLLAVAVQLVAGRI